jgi:hypothetical protein
MTNPLAGKKQMAIHVKDSVYLFDVSPDARSMAHNIEEGWRVVVTFKIASYEVKLENKDQLIKEAKIEFPVISQEAMLFLNGQAKVTKGHLDSIPHLGAVVDHFHDIYEHQKNSPVQTLQVEGSGDTKKSLPSV